MRIFLLTPLFIPLFLIAQPADVRPIATVGDIVITEKEFLSRYELTPGLHRKTTQTEANKMDFLVSLIAEKLLIVKARQSGLETDTMVQSNIREVERLLVRDELYRKEISQRITITERERAEAMRRAKNDMKVYFLFARTEEGATMLHDRITKGRPLENFSFDDNAREDFDGPDSAVARWGDVDERMEEVIYSLKLNETSAPVRLDDGWYIIKLMGKTITVTAGEKERAALKERVDATLRKRKEIARMSAFMTDALRTKRADVNARLLKSVVSHLWDDAQARNPRRSDTAMYFVDRISVEFLRNRLVDTMQAALVSFPHTRWSVEQALEKIRETNLATALPTLRTIGIDVEQRLREVIDQEFLTEIGYERGLHQSNAVRNDLRVWRDAYLAQSVRSRINDTVAITNHDIEAIRRVFRNDTAIVNNEEKAREKVFEIKSNDFVDRIAGETANTTRISIHLQNMKDLSVTATPSMVFRFLGFGGRMFAVPFVIPQTGWVQYWQDGKTVLP
jgi:hypothetical protein